ncbi:DUF2799 domain-containing protein [Vibrio sp. 10N]|uniref:DUF2799 domain-containing protein n=1 Tax=Vibrio sp. 10N TaxID=3058938 RepID=UPI00281354E9|nr:hypothetical protein VB10N_03340 [Vibrio sp. 10N]
MFKRVLIASAFVALSGCVQLTPPTDESAQSWQDFGYQWAMKGYIIESQSDLVKKSPKLSADQFAQYQVGYATGKSEYCLQEPFVLGYDRKIYYGICNDVDRRFNEEYWRGKNARNRN